MLCPRRNRGCHLLFASPFNCPISARARPRMGKIDGSAGSRCPGARATCVWRIEVVVNKRGTCAEDVVAGVRRPGMRRAAAMPDEAGRYKAIVGNMTGGSGETRIVAGFVAGCSHIADAGRAKRRYAAGRGKAVTATSGHDEPGRGKPGTLERRRLRHIRGAGSGQAMGRQANWSSGQLGQAIGKAAVAGRAREFRSGGLTALSARLMTSGSIESQVR
jgi:hypothetical protein